MSRRSAGQIARQHLDKIGPEQKITINLRTYAEKTRSGLVSSGSVDDIVKHILI
jgi:hypothetical protein